MFTLFGFWCVCPAPQTRTRRKFAYLVQPFLLAFPCPPHNFRTMEPLNIAKMLMSQRAFVAQRKWGKYHTPKNLSMALAVEAAELMEIFQWLSQAEARAVMKDPAKARAVSHELADVFHYLLRLADVLNVNLGAAFWDKMRHNQAKYPVHLARGNAKKYTELSLSRKRKAKPA